MILGSENRPQTVSQLVSQSHMFYVSGGKSIDKNISLSYWFVIDYCFLITQWLMMILFFGPEGHMSYSFNSPLILSFIAESTIKLGWIQFRHLHLGAVLVPWPSLPFLPLSHSFSVLCFRETLACWAGLDKWRPNRDLKVKPAYDAQLRAVENTGKSSWCGGRLKYLVSTPLWIFESG